MLLKDFCQNKALTVECAGSYVANGYFKKQSNASMTGTLEVNMLSGGLNTVIQASNLTPRMSRVTFFEY